MCMYIYIYIYIYIHSRSEIRNAMVWASYSSFFRNCKKLSKVRYSAAEFLVLGVLIWSHRGVMFENVKFSAPAAPKRKFVAACGAKTHLFRRLWHPNYNLQTPINTSFLAPPAPDFPWDLKSRYSSFLRKTFKKLRIWVLISYLKVS